MHSFLHVFHHFTHDHTKCDLVWCIHFFTYFTILPMITFNGTKCGEFISSRISPYCPWSHSMGPSVVHSIPHYFTILPMITLNGTECGAFITSLISPFFSWSHLKGSSMVHSFLHAGYTVFMSSFTPYILAPNLIYFNPFFITNLFDTFGEAIHSVWIITLYPLYM